MAVGVSIEVRGKEVQRKLAKFGKKLDTRTILAAIGLRQLRWIDKNFKVGGLERKWKPLARSTVAGRRKGSSKPLLNTRKLQASFVFKVLADQVKVGSRDVRAKWHHEGTKPYTIKPKSKKMLRFKTEKGTVFTTKVDHPGLPSRPLIPSKRVAERLARRVVQSILDKAAREASK